MEGRDPVRAIADAVLYEGYILWPYRRSAMKNHQRWTFGGVYPQGHSEGRTDDPWVMQTQVLLEGTEATTVSIGVRFLHVVRRDVARWTDGLLEPVDELILGSERHLSWEEAVEREFKSPELSMADLDSEHRLRVAVEAASEEEELLDSDGSPAGAILRSWEGLDGVVAIGAERLSDGLHRVTVRIENTTPWTDGPRGEVQKRTFCSTHTVLRATSGAFVSVTDPPETLVAEAGACRNEQTWPVFVGEPEDRSTMLSSPIILEDHPQIAPESPGDLFDGGEIDQMLVLNILALTDEEKAEMRDSDPKAREILERTEALTGAEQMTLHGTLREFGMARSR